MGCAAVGAVGEAELLLAGGVDDTFPLMDCDFTDINEHTWMDDCVSPVGLP